MHFRTFRSLPVLHRGMAILVSFAVGIWSFAPQTANGASVLAGNPINPTTSLSTSDTAMIETAFTRWLERLDDDEVDDRLDDLTDKLWLASVKYRSNPFTIAVLIFIADLVDEAQTTPRDDDDDENNSDDDNDDEEDDEDDDEDDDDDAPFAFNKGSYKSGPKLVLGGENTGPVAKWELLAQREDIIINEIELTASSDIELAVEEIYLFDEHGTYLGSATPQDDTARFSDLDYTLEQGSTELYAVLETSSIGKTNRGPQLSEFDLSLQITDAEGAQSGNEIDGDIDENTSDSIIISSVMITDVLLTNSFESYKNDTRLIDNGATDIALLVIETAETENYRDDSPTEARTVIESFTVTVSNMTEDEDALESIRLRRLDTTSSRINGTVDGNQVTFDLTDFSNDAEIIEGGETAVYVIEVTADLDANEDDEFIEISIDNLDDGFITYRSDSPGAETLETIYLNKNISSVSVEE